jgi:hypothetical protein
MGAHALLNNGAVYSRVGTSLVAMAASDKQVTNENAHTMDFQELTIGFFFVDSCDDLL